MKKIFLAAVLTAAIMSYPFGAVFSEVINKGLSVTMRGETIGSNSFSIIQGTARFKMGIVSGWGFDFKPFILSSSETDIASGFMDDWSSNRYVGRSYATLDKAVVKHYGKNLDIFGGIDILSERDGLLGLLLYPEDNYPRYMLTMDIEQHSVPFLGADINLGRGINFHADLTKFVFPKLPPNSVWGFNALNDLEMESPKGGQGFNTNFELNFEGNGSAASIFYSHGYNVWPINKADNGFAPNVYKVDIFGFRLSKEFGKLELAVKPVVKLAKEDVNDVMQGVFSVKRDFRIAGGLLDVGVHYYLMDSLRSGKAEFQRDLDPRMNMGLSTILELDYRKDSMKFGMDWVNNHDEDNHIFKFDSKKTDGNLTFGAKYHLNIPGKKDYLTFEHAASLNVSWGF